LLAIALAAPLVGCGAAADGGEGQATEGALSGHQWEEGTTLAVTANKLNVRERGSAYAQIVAVLNKDDEVTVVTASGRNGWVNIRTPDGVEGWASGTYLAQVPENSDTSTPDGPTCAAKRAEGVVNEYEKALHDTIAFAEGTRNRSNDGYDIIFGGRTTSTCARHPNICVPFQNTCSTAAGRYQFLSRTWNSISNAKGYATFEPENQERGAAYLVASVRKATVPSDRALTASEFTNVITKLSYEWASLPPGQYGQPIKTMSELRSFYCGLVQC
jgi:muramidase (phage lysozyme)